MLRQYNLTASNSQSDLTTTKTVAAGSANYDIGISLHAAFTVQVIYDDTDAADDTWILYGSENGTDFYPFQNCVAVTSTITAVKVVDGGWMKDIANCAYLRVAFTKNSSTTGTYLILLTTKEEE